MKYPRGASKRIETMLEERDRLERRHLRAFDPVLMMLEISLVQAITRPGGDRLPWSISLHARAMREVRGLGRQFGASVSARARLAAHDAVRLGAEQQPRAMAIFATAALGKRVKPPALELDAVVAMTTQTIDARTEDVGARTGEEIASAAVAALFLATRMAAPMAAGLVALDVTKLVMKKARDRSERVIITETTAGGAEGGDVARTVMVKRFPKMRKVWDSTLDLRVCRFCASVHHTVVDENETWGGIDDAPAHARCRCATMPWLDEWTDLLHDLEIAPGPRVGVQEFAHIREKRFGDSAVGSMPNAEVQAGIDRSHAARTSAEAMRRVERPRFAIEDPPVGPSPTKLPYR